MKYFVSIKWPLCIPAQKLESLQAKIIISCPREDMNKQISQRRSKPFTVLRVTLFILSIWSGVGEDMPERKKMYVEESN